MLSITGATPRHDGNYTCYVTNAAASVNYTANLHIDGTWIYIIVITIIINSIYIALFLSKTEL